MNLQPEHFKIGQRTTGDVLCGTHIFCGITTLEFSMQVEVMDFVLTKIDMPIVIEVEQDVCNVYAPVEIFIAESTINNFNSSLIIPTMIAGEVEVDASNIVEECISPMQDSLVRKTVPTFNYGRVTS